jgi:putative transposase
MSVLMNERPASIPLQAACDALGLNRSSVYARRRRASEPALSQGSRKTAPQPRALRPEERRRVHDVLTSAEFCNQPPVEVYHTLLERGVCLCSVSTMHRILREYAENGERRDQRAARHHVMPRLVAEKPNEVWTWDCSKLPTRVRSVYLTLYVVLDLFSRFVLAWMVSRKENSALAQQLMSEATTKYRIDAGQLTIHQDRGAPMIADRYIDLMSEMGVVLSHSRPRVSNDNAFSEAQFKTQKYQPDYPGRFDHGAHARTWCESYFDWYNFDHHHAGLAGYTPEQVFTGRYREVAKAKQLALDARFTQHPERFVAGPPTVELPPARVVINPVTPEQIAAGATDQVNFPTLPRVAAAQNKYALSLT